MGVHVVGADRLEPAREVVAVAGIEVERIVAAIGIEPEVQPDATADPATRAGSWPP